MTVIKIGGEIVKQIVRVRGEIQRVKERQRWGSSIKFLKHLMCGVLHKCHKNLTVSQSGINYERGVVEVRPYIQCVEYSHLLEGHFQASTCVNARDINYLLFYKFAFLYHVVTKKNTFNSLQRFILDEFSTKRNDFSPVLKKSNMTLYKGFKMARLM